MCFLCTLYVRMQCSVLLYSLLYKYCCTAVWRPPPPQCSYCSRHRLSGRRSYLHPQFTAQLVGACSYWHLGTEHVFLWPCAYYYYFLRLKFLTTKFLTGDAVCTVLFYSASARSIHRERCTGSNLYFRTSSHPYCNVPQQVCVPAPARFERNEPKYITGVLCNALRMFFSACVCPNKHLTRMLFHLKTRGGVKLQ